MPDEKKEWTKIRIHYPGDFDYIDIRKEDLDKIEAIGDVIDALQQGRALAEKLKNILK